MEERFVDQPDWIDIDTEENRECFPQNFEFQCCNDTLKDNPLGCVVGFHVKINRDSGKNGSGNADSLAAGEQKKVEPSVSDGMKGMVSRYAHCRNCKDEYDTTENSKQSCRYHPRELLYYHCALWIILM